MSGISTAFFTSIKALVLPADAFFKPLCATLLKRRRNKIQISSVRDIRRCPFEQPSFNGSFHPPIEMLRQTLMCHADTGLITYDSIAGHSKPYSDFSTRHVRHGFPRVLWWAYDHQVHVRQDRVVRLEDNVGFAEEP
ncbi:uncharacterized protein FIBRA_09142 [Fibroporia radiculosa]|uniref:Uncharacterized protein n=1 Tax=Fibroporia radiculosa TaxID=599839 RepID=J4H5J3_9APHY|nr:uncharacterized protein FIBRA_09142 [Fibroporia radiculosa]CCM06839.1 predicted protein [Fibroporia radiculosa]